MKIDFNRGSILNFMRENRPVVLATSIIALLLLGYVAFLLMSLVPRWQQRAELTSIIATIESVHANRTTQQQAVAAQINGQIAAAQSELDGQVDHFLTEAQAAAFLDDLYASAAATAVSIVDLQAQAVLHSPSAVGGKQAFDTRQFHLVAEGNLIDLNTFVGGLKQTAVATVSLKNLLITTGEASESGRLTIDLLLYTSPFSSGGGVTGLPDLMVPPSATAAPPPSPTPDISSQITQLDSAWAAEAWPEVIQLIQEIRQQVPTEPGMTEKLYAARVNYGYQLAGLGEKGLAAEQFEQALAINPEGGEAEAGLQSLFAPAPTATPSEIVYVVQRGDTLFSIARRFGSTVDAVKTANGLVNNNIVPGQQLVIP